MLSTWFIFGIASVASLREVDNFTGLGGQLERNKQSVYEMANTAKRLKAMVEDTVHGIKEKIPSVRVNGDSACRLPGTVNLCFQSVSGESLMHLLDLKGVCLSTSSACTSGKNEPSHVLLALGLTEQQAKSAVRISYGKYNCTDEVSKVVIAVCDAYEKISKNH